MSNLILVDDSRIRKDAFSTASRQLKKLEKLEERIRAFHQSDRKLFGDWYDLTFRDRRLQMDNLRGEYQRLAEFYNWMNALVAMEDLSLPQAAYLLRLEENRYRHGTSEERREIETLRRLREEYIRAQLEKDEARARRRARREDEPQDTAADLDQDSSPDEDLEELEALAALPDDELDDFCADPETAFLILGDCLKAADEAGDFGLFFRVWDRTHLNHQKMFASAYRKAYGRSLFEVIEEMRAKTKPNAGRSFTNPEEAIKSLYRQLVRKLHPDVAEGALSAEDWRRGMWLRVQSAYKAKNLRQLNRLFHITLLRANELNDLRVGDLKTSQAWLADEIDETEASVRDLRKQHAWGFSRRKDYAPLVKKIEKQLAKDWARLEEQVVDLRTHLAFLERMGRETARDGVHRRRGPAARGRSRSRYSAEEVAEQMSFSEEFD